MGQQMIRFIASSCLVGIGPLCSHQCWFGDRKDKGHTVCNNLTLELLFWRLCRSFGGGDGGSGGSNAGSSRCCLLNVPVQVKTPTVKPVFLEIDYLFANIPLKYTV